VPVLRGLPGRVGDAAGVAQLEQLHLRSQHDAQTVTDLLLGDRNLPGQRPVRAAQGERLSVAPAHLEEAGAALARHPEIAFAAATTGPTNLYASVVCADQRELYRYLTTRVAALPAITHVETAPVIRTVKRAAS
jgi:hypothetical protein